MDLTLAACRGKDPDLFFDEVSKARRHEALSTCNSCPIQLACALAHSSDRTNVIYGTTGPGRRLLRRWAEDRSTMSDERLLTELQNYNLRQLEGKRAPASTGLVAWRTQPDSWIREVREYKARTGASVDVISGVFNCSTTGIKTILRGDVRREAGGPIPGPPSTMSPEQRKELEAMILPLRAQGLTVAEISDRLGLSREEVRRVTRRHRIDALAEWSQKV